MECLKRLLFYDIKLYTYCLLGETEYKLKKEELDITLKNTTTYSIENYYFLNQNTVNGLDHCKNIYPIYYLFKCNFLNLLFAKLQNKDPIQVFTFIKC